MHSATSAAWWERTHNFARTTAVASMIGALFGNSFKIIFTHIFIS